MRKNTPNAYITPSLFDAFDPQIEPSKKKRVAHNKGKTNSPLGHSHAWIDRTCEACGATFQTQVKRISRGGGRFCSHRCNPVYAPKMSPFERHRRHNLKANYGMTIEDYDALVDEQGNRCAICGSEPTGIGRYGKLVIDHDHNTGEVRQLLCTNCNRGIGWLLDDPDIVRRAFEYLVKHGSVRSTKCYSPIRRKNREKVI